MQEWSYAELLLQNPKPFVITVARLLEFICVHRSIGSGHKYTRDVLSSDVAASGVDLRIGCTQTVLVVAQHISYVYVHHGVGLTRLWSVSLLIYIPSSRLLTT
jgi:hypothetical protein